MYHERPLTRYCYVIGANTSETVILSIVDKSKNSYVIPISNMDVDGVVKRDLISFISKKRRDSFSFFPIQILRATYAQMHAICIILFSFEFYDSRSQCNMLK